MARTVAQLTEAARRLAADHLPLARRLARPFKQQIPDVWEEFESAACWALVASAAAYDGRVRFATFAWPRILGALRDVRRERAARHGHVVPLGRLDDLEAASVLAAAVDRRPTPADHLARAEALEARLAGLTAAQAATCRLYYADGLTHAEAARVLGLSQTRVQNLHREALDRLRGIA